MDNVMGIFKGGSPSGHIYPNPSAGANCIAKQQAKRHTVWIFQVFVFSFVICLTMSKFGRADDLEQHARAAFDEGRALFEKGDFGAAADAFRRANAIKPSWKILYNIGQSEAAAKRHGLALEAFEKYLAKGGDDVDATRRAEVITEIERLRTIVGTLEIKAPTGALVMVDGLERGTTPLPGRLRVAAGVEHECVVKQGDVVMASRIVSVGGRENLVIVADEEHRGSAPGSGVDKQPDQEAPFAATEEEKGRQSGMIKMMGWLSVGLSGALIVTGAVTGSVALKKDNELPGECTDEDPTGCPANEYSDIVDKRDRLATTSTVMFALGGAAAVAGVIMLVIGRNGGEENTAHELSITPAAGSGFAGVAVSGKF
jgi:hypothetical protein